MADGFYASNELVWVNFKSGFKVALKSEMDAGDQDAIDKAMATPGQDGTLVGQPASLRLLELNIVKIVAPDGTETKPTPDIVRKLSRSVMAKLLFKIQELNRPLTLMAEEG